MYSRNWVDGFTDEYVESNLRETKFDLDKRESQVSILEYDVKNQKQNISNQKKTNKNVYSAYISGAVAQLRKKPKDN